MIRLKVYEKMAEAGFRTRKALADATGITPQNLGAIVKGDGVKRIDLDTLDKLCRALRCQPGDLMEFLPNGRSM